MNWATAIPTSTAAPEFDLTPLTCLSGAIPADLCGSYYRNGAGRLERGGRLVGHWFDGDGAILGIHFAAGSAIATYRYVKTTGFTNEAAAGQLLHAGYGMLAPGSYFDRYRHGLKNAANTAVLALPDKLLALWEGGLPHALDRQTLETLGEDDLGGLASRFSAHPKIDPITGDIFNFGVEIGPVSRLHLYRCDRNGKLQQQNSLPLPFATTLHDMVLAGPYLVFCIPPVSIDLWPVLIKLKPYSEALQWQPELGTRIWVIDRHSFQLVAQSTVDPWYQWHFGNGHIDASGHIRLDCVRYTDFSTNNYLREVASGETSTASLGTLWHLEVEPHTAKLLSNQCVVAESCEFPVVPPPQQGQAQAPTWLNFRHPNTSLGDDYLGEIGCFQGDRIVRTQLDAHLYPGEPMWASSPSGEWIMSVIADTQAQTSELWLWDANAIDADPVCCLRLPTPVPLGFHGTWAAEH